MLFCLAWLEIPRIPRQLTNLLDRLQLAIVAMATTRLDRATQMGWMNKLMFVSTYCATHPFLLDSLSDEIRAANAAFHSFLDMIENPRNNMMHHFRIRGGEVWLYFP